MAAWPISGLTAGTAPGGGLATTVQTGGPHLDGGGRALRGQGTHVGS